MLALVLEGTIVLSLDVHMNSALILLGEITVGALKLSRLGADILECHCGDFPQRGGGKFNFLALKNKP